MTTSAGAEPVEILRSGHRPSRASPLPASLTFAWRALLKIKHTPEQLADVVGLPLMFTVLFTYLFGGALSRSTSEYLQFLLPGTLTLAVLFVTVYSGTTLNRDISSGAFDRFRSMPIWRLSPIVGGLLGDLGRYLLAAVLTIGLGLLMGFRPEGGARGVAAAVGLILVFASALSWAWIALGLVLRAPNAVNTVGFVILFPLTFVSNIFVDPHTMPTALRAFADINPITHLVSAVRGLVHGSVVPGEIIWVLVASLGFVAVLAPLADVLLRRRNR